MKLTILAVLLLCPIAVFGNNDATYHGGPDLSIYYTGSKTFNDNAAACANCHDGGFNSSSGNVKVFFNGSAATSYTPGSTIPVQITITDTGGGRVVWGFELAVRFLNAKPAGTLKAINSNTQVSTLTFPSPPNPVATHNGKAFSSSSTNMTFTVNWTAPADGSGGNIYFSVAGNAANNNIDPSGDRIYTNEVVLTPAASTPAPTVPSNGVVDGAGFSAKISGGGIGSIFGSNLAASTLSASALPLPTTLGTTSVTMNGIAAPLFFVSSGQINFQVPSALLSSATASLTVTTSGGTSPPITVTLSSASPGIFTIGGTQGAVQISNTTTFVAPVGSISGVNSRPAVAGDFITIYCSGLGTVSNPPADGAAAGSNPLSAASGVTVTLGTGSPIPAAFAGLSPGFVGLFQVNIQITPGLGTNSALPLVVTAANLKSNTATIAVQ